MSLTRAETDTRRWRLRARFFELVAELRAEALHDLLSLQSLYQQDWPRPIVTPIYAHSIWTQVVETPSWLERWTRRYNLSGSKDQWVEKTALLTLKHYLGPGSQTPTDRRKFEVPRLTLLPTDEFDGEAADRQHYAPRPFLYSFPPIDQTDEDWDDQVKAGVISAGVAWRSHLQEERHRAERAGYLSDTSRLRGPSDDRLKWLVQFQVLENGWVKIARGNATAAKLHVTATRTVEAQQGRLEKQDDVETKAQEVRRGIVSMAKLVGLPLRETT